MQPHLHSPADLNLTYEDVLIETPDKEKLHAWWLPASTSEDIRGSILYLHGNAENVSTHFANVAWLPGEGYNVLALDYRGYGKSTGQPDLQGVLTDIESGFNRLLTMNTEGKPVFILGQSIGGALALSFTGNSDQAKQHLSALVIDAGFESFRGIAREKVAELWLTWPFQYPLSWLIPSSYDPIHFIKNIPPIPTLFIHSKNDQIIPYTHGQTLFSLANAPKHFISTETPHIGSFMSAKTRTDTVEFLLKAVETPVQRQE
jgi:fermentation-respiration switch protein FrsA (DUF1100 family)